MATAEELITENIDLWVSTIEKAQGTRGRSKKLKFHGIKL